MLIDKHSYPSPRKEHRTRHHNETGTETRSEKKTKTWFTCGIVADCPSTVVRHSYGQHQKTEFLRAQHAHLLPGCHHKQASKPWSSDTWNNWHCLSNCEPGHRAWDPHIFYLRCVYHLCLALSILTLNILYPKSGCVPLQYKSAPMVCSWNGCLALLISSD